MAKGLITLDLDHTLWDTDPVLIAAEQAMYDWISEHSPNTAALFPPDSLREYRQQIAASYPELRNRMTALRLATLTRVFMMSGHDRTTAERMASDAFEVFYHARSQLTLFEGVEEALSTLREQYLIIAVTNGNTDLKIAGYDHLFDDLFNPDDHGDAKPAPDLFHCALERAGVSAAEAIHIGDHPEQDVAAAQHVGMKAIWFNNCDREWPLQDTQPDWVFSHWTACLPAIVALTEG